MSLELQIRQVLVELELVSGIASGQAYDRRSGGRSAEEPGGKCPQKTGNYIDKSASPEEKLDFRAFPLKTADEYRIRWSRAYSEKSRLEIVQEAKASVEAYKRQPKPTKALEPTYGSPSWKRYVSESNESHQTLADRFGVHRSYIQKVRRLYGTI